MNLWNHSGVLRKQVFKIHITNIYIDENNAHILMYWLTKRCQTSPLSQD